MNSAAKYADVMLAPRLDFGPSQDPSLALNYYFEYTLNFSKDVKRRVALEECSPEDFFIASIQRPIVGRTEKEAEEMFQELQSLMPFYKIPKPLFFGSAEKVADQIQEWYEAGAMDILIVSQEHPSGLENFIDLVVPILLSVQNTNQIRYEETWDYPSQKIDTQKGIRKY
ncbi:hypothetical protein [Paenibacillus solani]|uniref:hypothetical protein n=1 Tax=Paenibacillus solani TaxID=1705565 RepID=UPI0006C8DD38|nr:hypothetical protein [Paenibacillus solani]